MSKAVTTVIVQAPPRQRIGRPSGTHLLARTRVHQLGRSAACAQEPGHGLQVRQDVAVEVLISQAQVVVAVLAVGRALKTVLGTATVTQPHDRALTALHRQLRALLAGETAHDRGGGQRSEGAVQDTAQPPVRFHPVVTGVDVAIELHSKVDPVLGDVDAHRVDAEQGGQGGVEVLDEDAADVLADPLIEDRRQEAAVAQRAHASRGHGVPALGVEQLLGQEEAVLAVQVAGGAGGLGDHGQGQAGSEHRPLGHLVLRNACVCHGPPA